MSSVNVVAKRDSGRRAGPRTTAPVASNCEPWQWHSNTRSRNSVIVHPSCVHDAPIAAKASADVRTTSSGPLAESTSAAPPMDANGDVGSIAIVSPPLPRDASTIGSENSVLGEVSPLTHPPSSDPHAAPEVVFKARRQNSRRCMPRVKQPVCRPVTRGSGVVIVR